jgi:hypothetical protein
MIRRSIPWPADPDRRALAQTLRALAARLDRPDGDTEQWEGELGISYIEAKVPDLGSDADVSIHRGCAVIRIFAGMPLEAA